MTHHKPQPHQFPPPLHQSNHLQLKQNLLNKYFLTAQHEFDQQFLQIIFTLAENDQQFDNLIKQHSLKILHSKQKSSIKLLQNLITHPKYQHLAQTFLTEVIQLKIQVYNKPLLIYILAQLPRFINFINKSNTQEFIYSLVTFLSLKMRSFDLEVRITSLQTLKELGQIIQKQRGEWQKVMKKVIPMMIQKQRLVKEVSYIKGLFLQMLQDEFHQVRILTIICLGIYRIYMKPQDLKQIIIYMLNDQHELVRESALKTAKINKDLPLAKEDLQTLLMCLKQKRTNLRRLVYQNLAIIKINDVTLLILVLQKVLVALQNYRSDKKHIYRALFQLGSKYYNEIGKIYGNLGLNQMQEPNCKSILYKAKMVLCQVWWKRKVFLSDNIKLPSYFVKHMLYISDVQAYLFENPTNIQQQTETCIDYTVLKNNFHHLIRFIECQQDISQQFHRTLLQITRQFIIGHTENEILLKKLGKISINFNLTQQEINLVTTLYNFINGSINNFDQILEFILACIQNRELFQQKNTTVPYNKCTVSRLQPNLILSSKCKQFIEKVYLKCWKHSIIGKQRKIQYKKVSQLQLLNQNEVNLFWKSNLMKYNQIQCILITSNNKQQRILDNYDIEQK